MTGVQTCALPISADRPAEAHGTGANQTIDQHALYGGAAPCIEFPTEAGNPAWRATICRAVAAGGPVQVNIPFREPLVPDSDPGFPAGREDGGPWTRWTASTPGGAAATGLTPRTVLVVGDPVGQPAEITAAARAAARAGWPVIAEPTGTAAALAGGATVLANGSVLVNSGAQLPKPAEVLVVGRPTLSRGVGALLRSAGRVRVLGHSPD